jgi:hypothetical protein
MAELAEWESFYVIVGSAAGTLSAESVANSPSLITKKATAVVGCLERNRLFAGMRSKPIQDERCPIDSQRVIRASPAQEGPFGVG